MAILRTYLLTFPPAIDRNMEALCFLKDSESDILPVSYIKKKYILKPEQHIVILKYC